jgi:hypothetical protein
MSEDTETLPPDPLATFDVEPASDQDDERTQIVVRLRRSYWHDHDGAYTRTELRYLKRHTKGFNVFEDDCSMVGADEVLAKITNLQKCKDGVYQLVICREHRDWETGYVEDWDYELIPFDPKEDK